MRYIKISNIISGIRTYKIVHILVDIKTNYNEGDLLSGHF